MQSTWIVYEHISPKGKVYVGITHYEDPNKRWQNGLGYKKCPFFAPAIIKYGWDNFQHNIIAKGLSRSEAAKLEKERIAMYKELKLSYNSADGGFGHTGKFSPEHCAKIATNNRAKDPEVRAKISATLKSKKLQPWNKGKTDVYTEETRYAMGAPFRGKVGPNKGKKMPPVSDETRKKLSESHKGKNTWSKGSKRGPYSEEHRANISAGLIGKRKGIPLGPRPDDVKAKISAGHKGRRLMSKKWVAPKHVFPDQVEQHLADGWEFGKIIIDGDIAYRWDKPTESWVIYPKARIEQIKKSRR